jgi:Zn-dependent peptidase ImmA (M78 family)
MMHELTKEQKIEVIDEILARYENDENYQTNTGAHIDDSFFINYFQKKRENPADWQANEFAMRLLMPEDAFREALKKTKHIGEIAEIFGVPAMAVKIRALELGYKF